MDRHPLPFTRDRSEEFDVLRRAAQLDENGNPRQKIRKEWFELAVLMAETQSNGRRVQMRTPCSDRPLWGHLFDNFTEVEGVVSKKLEKLRNQQTELLHSKFYSGDVDDATQQQNSESSAREIKLLLCEMQRMIVSCQPSVNDNNPDERVIVENVKRHLSQRLSRLVHLFNDRQEFFASRLKTYNEKAERYKLFGSREAHMKVEEEEKIAHLIEQGYTHETIAGLLLEEERQKWLNNEVKEVVSSLKDLQAIFQEMGTLVVEQGSLLDRIDVNVLQAQVGVRQGVESLERAKESQTHCCTM
ncbi:putative Syntaxin [Trypanosoma vivax]|uniref:Putative syntaxin n=1 Tax=Trypanosoma vivax (strain Y486) TaxID=1055687 RepID=G0U8A5_TRYVY|nr:putative Syntaxin [Trypanosoma vivax]CCC52116.1 putative syntaxin [Trypanosoma vivax Y486]